MDIPQGRSLSGLPDDDSTMWLIPPTDAQRRYLPWKRVLDVLLSALLLILLSPVMLIVAIIVKCTSLKDPILFRQARVGKNYHAFRIYKFRTMYATAPHNVASRDLTNPYRQITRVGKFLRKSSLDELPQLFNVLKGDMSLVGPRPLIFTERDIRSLRKQNGVYAMKPGITGIAQINGRDKISVSEKVRMDADYVRYFDFSLDCRILWRTIFAVLLHKGVVEGRPPSKS